MRGSRATATRRRERVSICSPVGEGEEGGLLVTYVEHTPLVLALEDQHGEGRQEEGAEEARCPQLPGQLLLASPGEDPLHQADDVERGEDVEDLEYYVVHVLAAAKQVGVAGEEDDAVEHLGDERDA